ncbi:MAG TPA: hypothetical protein VF640_03910 [Acidimicrobiales bacterium]|jgi:hypothetical protein
MTDRPTGSAKEFKVRIDVPLPDELHARIERAVQRAVLIELAGADVANGYSVAFRAPKEREAADAPGGLGDSGRFDPSTFPGNGSTAGIWIREERAL